MFGIFQLVFDVLRLHATWKEISIYCLHFEDFITANRNEKNVEKWIESNYVKRIKKANICKNEHLKKEQM